MPLLVSELVAPIGLDYGGSYSTFHADRDTRFVWTGANVSGKQFYVVPDGYYALFLSFSALFTTDTHVNNRYPGFSIADPDLNKVYLVESGTPVTASESVYVTGLLGAAAPGTSPWPSVLPLPPLLLPPRYSFYLECGNVATGDTYGPPSSVYASNSLGLNLYPWTGVEASTVPPGPIVAPAVV